MRILSEQHEALLKDERRVLDDLRTSLVQFGAADEDNQTITRSVHQLDELFLLVIVGEFNAGKSAFINALLGQRLLKEGVTPTTTQINILRYGETQERTVIDEHQHVITLPAEMLKEISIVDTPGTNAVIREHETITSQFVPQSDLVLFLTSVDRPFTESERIFLERIRDWGKKVVMIINKIDILDNEEDLRQVENFVSENARALLGLTPEIFPISARLASRSKNGEPNLWPQSRFEPLEKYIYNTLDERGRIQLKFLNPLGVGMHLVEKYLQVASTRLDLLRADFEMLTDIEAQLKLFREDMMRDFNFRIADIDNILLEMEQRGEAFFDDTFRLARVFDLMNKDRIQKEFESQVIMDVPQRIERKVNELIDWLVDTQLRQWQAVNEHIAERRREHQERIVGDTGGGSFNYDRERLMEGVGRTAQRVVDTFDKTTEARSIAEDAQNAVAASLAVEAGAIGLGALVTILATTAAADVTGVVAASVVAALGLFIIPAKRNQAKEALRIKVADLRKQLVHSLRTQFEREMDRSLQQINEAIAPYTRFVRAERGKLQEGQTALSALRDEIERLRVRISEI